MMHEFSRTELLIGEEGVKKLALWCLVLEALVPTALKHWQEAEWEP